MAETGLERLHPLSVLFSVATAAMRLLVPGLFVVFFRPGGQADVWLMVLFLPSVVAALVKYATYGYRMDPDELVIREGMITRNERHIPYGRIQNIDLVQNPLQRALGVAEVRIETASGDKPEAVMRVLSLGAVEELRRRVFRRGQVGAAAPVDEAAVLPAAEPSRVLVRTSVLDLVLVGLSSGRGLAVVAAGLGLLWQLDFMRDIDPRWLEKELSGVQLELPGPLVAIVFAVAAAGLGVVLLSLLSIGWAVVRYWGFTLVARGDDLRIEYGLLTRVTATIPRHRIQLLSLARGPLARAAGRVAVRVETAGQHEQEGRAADRLWLAPLLPDAELPALLRAVLPEGDLGELEWRGLAPGATARMARKGLLVASIVSALAAAAFGPYALLMLPPLAAWVLLHARLWVRHAGWALGLEACAWKSGVLSRRTSVVRYEKIQVLSLSESPFDRRRGMAAMQVDTAGAGRAGHGMDLRYLDAAAAAAALERLAHETRARPFRW